MWKSITGIHIFKKDTLKICVPVKIGRKRMIYSASQEKNILSEDEGDDNGRKNQN